MGQSLFYQNAMKNLLLLALWLFPLLCSGQFHDNHVLLGYKGGPFNPVGDIYGISALSFTDGKLHVEENFDLGMYFDETNSILSDSNGILLAYTNGVDIGNTAWLNMENGEALTDDGPGPNIWPQMALMLPMPGHNQQISLLYGDEEFFWPYGPTGDIWVASNRLYSATIDLSLNNGLGSVVARDQVVIDDTLSIGKFTAAKHANGRDWWVLAHEQYSNRYYRLLLDPNGIHLVGLQSVGLPYIDGVGQACFSPDGEHYVVIDGVDFDSTTEVGCSIQIYNFDRCTGLLSNHQQIIESQGAWAGGAISPNSRYFYAGFQFFARQYDLWAADIAASGVQVMEYDGYLDPYPTRSWYHQLLPDGKIYVCTSTRSNVLHVIQYPDEAGTACHYEQHAVHLPTQNAFSLPNFPYFRLGPLDGSSCDTLNLNNVPQAWYRYEQDTIDPLQVEFRDLSFYEPNNWSWDFGDGTPMSTERHPVHLYDSAGVYEVCLSVANQNGSNSHCKTLYLGVSALENPVLQAQVQVAPNPFFDHLNVALSASLRNPVFSLYDQMGRLCCKSALVLGITEVETSSLSAGMYFWEIRSAGALAKAGKVIKLGP